MFLSKETILCIETGAGMKMKKRDDLVIRIIPGDNFTPCALAEKLDAKVVLESSSYNLGKARHSLLMIDEAFRIVQNSGKVSVEGDNADFGIDEFDNSFTSVISAVASQHRALEFPFPAGGIGYFSFEFASYCDAVSFSVKKDYSEIPEALFIFGHTFVVYDHFTEQIYIVGVNYNGAEIDLEKAVKEIEKRINDLNFNYLVQDSNSYRAEVVYETPYEKYLEMVREGKREISEGNLLQVVLSRKIRIKTDIPPFKAYKKLRMESPSPYMFYLDFDDFQIFGSSPEVHLKVENRQALVRPIAGTRKRGKNQAEDEMLEKELLADEKESAEHLMLVDLARNDLGRVCRAGSVRITDSRSIEKYKNVMHIVSEVQGDLENGSDCLDALKSTFPAGTVSGAPKIRAISVIDRLEEEDRGFYAGVVGYLEPGGNLNTCITIRSGMKKGDILTIQAGAGIVYDSVPENEYRETTDKIRSIAKIAGLEV